VFNRESQISNLQSEISDLRSEIPNRKSKIENRKSKTPPGFTLVEGLIAATVLAVAVVGIMGPVSASFQQRRFAQETLQATALLRQLMEEVISRPFVDPTDGSVNPGPEPDETARPAFDNIDDYHGYSDASDALRLLDGQTLALSGGRFQRQVSVTYRAAPGSTVSAPGDFALVTVTVTTPGGHTVTAQRLACRYRKGG